MRRLFIDCGTHLFQGFCNFVEKYNIDSSWKCYSFESNPLTFEMSQENYKTLTENWNLDIDHYNKAIYDTETKIKVNCSLDSLGYVSQASNVLENPPVFDTQWKNSFEYMTEEVSVETINFSQFLFDNVSKEDFVLIKMDIEGSEFKVIDSLIETGAYKLINELHCEFHERFFDNPEEYKMKKENYKQLFSQNQIIIEEWV